MQTLVTLLMAAAIPHLLLAADPGNPAEVFAKTSDAYKKLKSYQIETETRMVVARNGAISAIQYKTVLAADDQGRSYVENLSEGGSELRVSNGSTTWKYSGSQKAWSKEQLAQVSGLDEGETSEDAPAPQDLFSQTVRSYISRYKGLTRYGKIATYMKDDKVKVNGRKTLCHVYHVVSQKGSTNELWIADDSFLVLRHTEKAAGSEIVTEFKQINPGPQDVSLFDFQPPNGARQVANVLLPSERNVSLVGTLAMDFTLKTLDGETVHLSELHGKDVLLDFWATWCPPCRHELPTIASLDKKLKGSNVVIFGVNDEDNSTAKHFLESSHYEFATLHDANKQVMRMYSCYSIPTVFIIDPSGKIVAHYVGERSENEFMASLREAGMTQSK